MQFTHNWGEKREGGGEANININFTFSLNIFKTLRADFYDDYITNMSFYFYFSCVFLLVQVEQRMPN